MGRRYWAMNEEYLRGEEADRRTGGTLSDERQGYDELRRL